MHNSRYTRQVLPISHARKTPIFMKKTLYFSIASHGFGHIGMTAPIINYCLQYLPSVTVVIQCATTKENLKQWIKGEFIHVNSSTDIGVINKTAFIVQREATHQLYLKRHLNWSTLVEQQVQLLSTYSPDLVISNISETIIEAAHQANINCLALCSLNWADIYWAYCQHLPRAQEIFERLVSAYQKANHFLTPAPSMKMPHFNNTVPIGPIARTGRTLSSLQQALNIPLHKKVVLVSMGGIPTPINTSHWPQDDNIIWLGNFGQNARKDLIYFPSLDLSYIDILSNCDALITKPGYGNFVKHVVMGFLFCTLGGLIGQKNPV